MIDKKTLEALKKKQAETVRSRWSKEELATLKELLDNGVKSPRIIYESNMLPNRTKSAIEDRIYKGDIDG